jgi:hypothetical protein
MRYLACAALAALALALSAPPRVWAFEMNAAGSSGPGGDSAKFTDPDEQLEAIAGGDGGSQRYGLRLPALTPSAGPVKLDSSDRGSTWDAQRIRLVFGPISPLRAQLAGKARPCTHKSVSLIRRVVTILYPSHLFPYAVKT